MPAAGAAGKKQMEVIQLFFRHPENEPLRNFTTKYALKNTTLSHLGLHFKPNIPTWAGYRLLSVHKYGK